MKHFIRSTRYVLHYRARVAAAVACVVLISLLWVGGLGMIIPGAKILISEEGLHGWSDQSVTHSRLDFRTVRRKLTSESRRQRWAGVTEVMIVTLVDEDGVAAAGKIEEFDWIIGFAEPDGTVRPVPFDELHQKLAAIGDDPIRLWLYNPDTDIGRGVTLTPKSAEGQSGLLQWVTAKIPRPAEPIDRYYLLVWLLGIVAVLTVLRDLLRFAHGYVVRTTVQRGLIDLRCECYSRTLRLPLGYFTRAGASDTTSRFMIDVVRLAQGQIALFGKTMVEPGKLIATFCAALYVNWRLTLLVCVAGPPAYFMIRSLGKMMRRSTKRALQSKSEMLAALEETLGGIRVVKAYTTEDVEQRRFKAINRKFYKEVKPMSAAMAAAGPAVEALGVVAAMGAVALAGYWVFRGQLDRDEFLGLMALMAAMFDPVRKLSQVSTRFHGADAAAQRVFELLDQPPERERDGATELPRHSESIEFRDVSFAYEGAAQESLRQISLTIPHGECVAIVGGNGSGKTTLLSMLPRFFDPDSGAVLVDGKDVADVTLSSLRDQMGIVTQEAVIFHATVAENLAYGTPGVSREQIVAAAKQAFVDEFVQQLPDGYDTVIAERGGSLSGGQRQRMAIARAILRDPALVIFDEAMSQIDSESEAKINQAVQSFMVGRTTLLIAHRFSTVVGADRVIVMDAGRVIDVGTHVELLARCGVYRTLFETQLIADEPQD